KSSQVTTIARTRRKSVRQFKRSSGLANLILRCRGSNPAAPGSQSSLSGVSAMPVVAPLPGPLRSPTFCRLSRRDEGSQLPARIEHARLHRGFADADNLDNLLDRFAG